MSDYFYYIKHVIKLKFHYSAAVSTYLLVDALVVQSWDTAGHIGLHITKIVLIDYVYL